MIPITSPGIPLFDHSPQVDHLLASIGFIDHAAAIRCVKRLSTQPGFPDILSHLLQTLAVAADPDRVLVEFERLAQAYPNKIGLFTYLADHPRAIDILVAIFSSSQFLTEILLRTPDRLERLLDLKDLSRPKTTSQLIRTARQGLTSLKTSDGCSLSAGCSLSLSAVPDQVDALRRFQRQELLRIGACDLLALLDLPATTGQLSNLADALVQVSLDIAFELSGRTYSSAQMYSSADALENFAVIAMGKLGGQELNYSSDIDLLFIARANPSEYIRLGERLIEILARVTAEGFLYRVDMRLRPWGKDGLLVTTPDSYASYLSQHARLWEKQALLKSRWIAGDPRLGQDFFNQVRPLLFSSELETVRQDIRAMKKRTEAFLEEKGRSWGEVKLGAGSIRDVEFVAQFLQLAHGAQQPGILTPNTLEAITLLKRYGFLSAEEGRVLKDGYIFFRTIEHYLQLMHYQQTNTLPRDHQELAQLAQRLGFHPPAQATGPADTERPADTGHPATDSARSLFLERYDQHCRAIRDIYLRYFGTNRMDTNQFETASPHPDSGSQEAPPEQPDQNPSGTTHPSGYTHPPDLSQHLTRLDPSYAATFTPSEIEHHSLLMNRLTVDHLVEVEPTPLEDGSWQVLIVANDYPGELSIICGLLYVFNLNIDSGYVFTYEPLTNNFPDRQVQPTVLTSPTGLTSPDQAMITSLRQKIVDVFRIHYVDGDPPDGLGDVIHRWGQYAAELEQLLRLMQSGDRNTAFSQLTRRVGMKLTESSGPVPPLYPIEVVFDNSLSEKYTVLKINSQDTLGFLYELTSALALRQIYISQVRVESHGSRVSDTLSVSTAQGQKITDPARQRELRSAIVLIKHFTHLLPFSANPEAALLHFRSLIETLIEQSSWPDEVTSLERPEVLHALASVLGVSDFLWEDFLRMQYENLFPVVRDIDELGEAKSRSDLQQEMDQCLSFPCEDYTDPIYGAGWRGTVNAFKDRLLFRTDMRTILGYTDAFDQFSRELTDLAEVVILTTIRLCQEELGETYGIPLKASNGGSKPAEMEPCSLAICALGKFGGQELGFASDIELMFVYSGQGQTSGPKVILAAEYYEKLVQLFLGAIRTRREGIFHIDLQLRPYGKAGSLAVSLEAFRQYFAPEGPAWPYERQALVRLRPIDESSDLARQVVALRDQCVYTGEAFDATAMRAMRERQVRHTVSGGTFNAKYSPGGLLDIEYLVQGLQITHGFDHPELRSTNTREVLAGLANLQLLDEDDYTRLRKAHTFLRWLINTLRVVRGNARDLTVPPYGSDEYEYLTRRLRYGSDIKRLQFELLRFTSDVQELNRKLLVAE